MSGYNSCGLFSRQALKGTCGELGECLIGGSKNGGCFNSFQSLDKAKIGNKFDQSSEGTGSNGNIDKVTNSSNLCRCGLRCSNNDVVNNMNDTIASSNIGSDNVDSLTHVSNLNATCFGLDETNCFTSECLNISGGNISSFDSGSSDNVSGNDGFGLFRGQTFEGTCGELGKGFIRWSKDGCSFNFLQGSNKAKISDNFNQSGEGTCSNGNINKVTNYNFGCNSWYLWCSNNDIVNNMNDTIAGSNISSDNVDSLTHVSNLNTTFGSLDKSYCFTSECLNIPGGNISSFDSGSSDNMSSNDGFGLFRSQTFKGTCGELGKGFIRRSKDGGGFNSLQGLNKAEISNDFDQSGEGTCSNGNINKVTHGGNSGGDSG